jgi:acylphosphatase
MTALLHYNILVKGKVQGVWFRKYTKEQADKLGIKGSVKNTADGNVYIEAEAPSEAIQEFLVLVKRGSPLSQVTEVKWEKAAVQNFSTFEILYH